MRFTIGQTCSHWRTRPASVERDARRRRGPSASSPPSARLLSHAPDHVPSIIVARVGMKLSVDHPPSLKRNGDSRGKRFRNQVSNAHDRFEFLLKWARNPV